MRLLCWHCMGEGTLRLLVYNFQCCRWDCTVHGPQVPDEALAA